MGEWNVEKPFFERIMQEKLINTRERDLYNALLLVYANSDLEEKAEKSLKVLQQMKSLNIPPSVVSYNILLKACGSTQTNCESSRKKALDIAVQEFGNLVSSDTLKPDSTTYCSLLWICHYLLKDSEE